MLRQPGSRYEIGRSTTLLKVKNFHDAEARVLQHQEGAGRHKGRLGALLVELENGTRFAVGTGFSDAEREHPPAIGSVITFRYQELSDGGVPRFPSFVGIRDAAPTTLQMQFESARSTLVAPEVSASAKPAPAPVSSSPRRYEFHDATAHKFWEISSNGGNVSVRFGRVGTAGQTQTKALADIAVALKHVEKLVKEKTSKGYVVVA